VRLAAISIALLFANCAIPITRSDQFIVVSSEPQRDCVSVARAIRRIALGASYAEVPLPRASRGRIQVVAVYRRGEHRIALYLWDGACVVYAQDRQQVLGALRARAFKAHVEQKTYASTFELIPYAP
jgi:hypothetical protein